MIVSKRNNDIPEALSKDGKLFDLVALDKNPDHSPSNVKAAGRIVMLVQCPYPQDTRVRNEAQLLLSQGYEVSVISVRKPDQLSSEDVEGVRVYRVPELTLFQKTRSNEPMGRMGMLLLKLKSYLGYAFEFWYFTAACFVVASYIFLKRGFDVIHAHNPPDTLFLAALPFKLLGKKFVFDHHDLSPELYMSRYGAEKGLVTKILGMAEWCSLKLADVVIATNESYKKIQIERANKDPRVIFVVRNGPNKRHLMHTEPNPKFRPPNNKFLLCYVGDLNPQDGVDYLLRSLHHLIHDLKRDDFQCVIIGSGDSLEDLRDLARELKLDGAVKFPGFISEDDLQAYLSTADICVDPDPSSPLNDVSTWIKITEYMAHAKPIVTFDLKETRYSAQDAAVYVQPNDEKEFARGIIRLMDDPQLRARMGAYGRQRVERELQWSVVGQNLVSAYQRLALS
jgi:glycosyltransferase involved in cell wall biosynthesis